MKRRIEEKQTASVDDTHALAAQLAAEMPDGTILCLHGDLGTGKTCFVQGLARALGIRRPVGSPTFTLINEYRAQRALVHIDLYRLRGAVDAFSLGLEDYLAHPEGLVVIEWAERIADFIPEEAWHIHLASGAAETDRRIRVDRPSDEGGPPDE